MSNQARMTRVCRTFVFGLLASCLACTNDAVATPDAEREDNVHIIYLDPEVATYDAVTRESLIYNRPCILALPPKRVVNAVSAIVDQAEYGRFDNSRVRIKVDGTASGPIYVDAAGGVLIEGAGISKKMSVEEFASFKHLFEPLRGSKGCNNMGRWP